MTIKDTSKTQSLVDHDTVASALGAERAKRVQVTTRQVIDSAGSVIALAKEVGPIEVVGSDGKVRGVLTSHHAVPWVDPEERVCELEATVERLQADAERWRLAFARAVDVNEDIERDYAAALTERDEARALVDEVRRAWRVDVDEGAGQVEELTRERDALRSEVERLTRERDEAQPSQMSKAIKAYEAHVHAVVTRSLVATREALGAAKHEDLEKAAARVVGERDSARAELARLRRVVEAARRVWEEACEGPTMSEADDALGAALDAAEVKPDDGPRIASISVGAPDPARDTCGHCHRTMGECMADPCEVKP